MMPITKNLSVPQNSSHHQNDNAARMPPDVETAKARLDFLDLIEKQEYEHNSQDLVRE